VLVENAQHICPGCEAFAERLLDRALDVRVWQYERKIEKCARNRSDGDAPHRRDLIDA
jgi:hypothetical protein